MAANPKTPVIACLGKRLAAQIWSSNSKLPLPVAAAPITLRTAHTSVYDKNVDDPSSPQNIVPDDVIQPHTDKYWAPDPQTGVFGPASEQSGERGVNSSPVDAGNGSVLEEKAWFRPNSIEDLEKP